jgi:hypothetical protein
MRGGCGHTHFRQRAFRWLLRRIEMGLRATVECRGDTRTRLPHHRTVARRVGKCASAPPGVPFRLSAVPFRPAWNRIGPCGESCEDARYRVGSSESRRGGRGDMATEAGMSPASATYGIERTDVGNGTAVTSLHSFSASYIRSEIESTTSAGIRTASIGGGMSPEDGQEQKKCRTRRRK